MTNLLLFAAEAAHETGGAAPFPPFNTATFASQLFWLVVLFGFLYIVLSRFILPRLGGVLEHRESTIANDLDEAARLSEQAKEAQKAIEIAVAKAHAKARETANKARLKIDQSITAETAKVDAELETKLDAAEQRIEKLRSEAMKRVEGIAEDAAQSILSRFDVSPAKGEIQGAVKSALSEA